MKNKTEKILVITIAVIVMPFALVIFACKILGRKLSLLWRVIWSWLALKVMWVLSVTGKYRSLVAFCRWLGWDNDKREISQALDDFEKRISE